MKQKSTTCLTQPLSAASTDTLSDCRSSARQPQSRGLATQLTMSNRAWKSTRRQYIQNETFERDTKYN